MARASLAILQFAGQHRSRRRHQFVPSIPGAASRLEDRALLSAIGAGSPPHALVASPNPSQPPPNSSVGPIVGDAASDSAPRNSAVGPIVG
jgi:hypothetical protein